MVHFFRFMCVCVCCIAELAGIEQERILYLTRQGNIDSALDLYEAYHMETGSHHSELLQDLGLAILEQGVQSASPETRMLALFGAGISGNEHTIPLLEKGLRSEHPQMQAAAVHLLANMHNDSASQLIQTAMSSNYLPVRLEGALCLARTGNPRAYPQIEALMQKVPEEALVVFPRLLALLGDSQAMNALRKLLAHPNVKVRIEAILACAGHGRDDLLPQIRILSKHVSTEQQEAACAALGRLKDEASVPRLLQLAQSRAKHVKTAACAALCFLGRSEVLSELVRQADEEDVFAVYALGDFPEAEKALVRLMQSPRFQVRLNAGLALLRIHHPACVPAVREILIKDRRDLAFLKQSSPGKSLTSWKAVPCAKQNCSDKPYLLDMSFHLREEVLREAMELPEDLFLEIAQAIFENNQNDLVPMLSELLVSSRSPRAVELLKRYRERVGSPLIRNYCNLALVKLKEQGPYRDALRNWVASYEYHQLIQFRPVIPWEMRTPEISAYYLTPHDASKLLVDSFEALLQTHDPATIDILLHAIRHGNAVNRFALAGILIRTAQ